MGKEVYIIYFLAHCCGLSFKTHVGYLPLPKHHLSGLTYRSQRSGLIDYFVQLIGWIRKKMGYRGLEGVLCQVGFGPERRATQPEHLYDKSIYLVPKQGEAGGEFESAPVPFSHLYYWSQTRSTEWRDWSTATYSPVIKSIKI